jgi:putative ABC transport system permease protein
VVFPKDGPIEIVGIARDLREAGLSGPVPAVMYVPVAQAGDAAIRTTHSYFQVSWIVKARPLTPEVTRRIREELRLIDPQQPITAFRSMDEIKARAMSGESFQMALLSAFAVIGALLAAAGIYGLTAYNVSQRTREFGIRLALGATRRSVLVLVLRQAVFLAVAGVAIGAAAARMTGETLETFVFGVSTADVPTFAAVAGVLVAVALLASLVPAFRAIRLNPVAALRE